MGNSIARTASAVPATASTVRCRVYECSLYIAAYRDPPRPERVAGHRPSGRMRRLHPRVPQGRSLGACREQNVWGARSSVQGRRSDAHRDRLSLEFGHLHGCRCSGQFRLRSGRFRLHRGCFQAHCGRTNLLRGSGRLRRVRIRAPGCTGLPSEAPAVAGRAAPSKRVNGYANGLLGVNESRSALFRPSHRQDHLARRECDPPRRLRSRMRSRRSGSRRLCVTLVALLTRRLASQVELRDGRLALTRPAFAHREAREPRDA